MIGCLKAVKSVFDATVCETNLYWPIFTCLDEVYHARSLHLKSEGRISNPFSSAIFLRGKYHDVGKVFFPQAFDTALVGTFSRSQINSLPSASTVSDTVFMKPIYTIGVLLQPHKWFFYTISEKSY